VIVSIDRLELKIGLLTVWAVASLAGLWLLNIWVAIVFTLVLAYLMRTIWRAILKNNVTHDVVTTRR